MIKHFPISLSVRSFSCCTDQTDKDRQLVIADGLDTDKLFASLADPADFEDEDAAILLEHLAKDREEGADAVFLRICARALEIMKGMENDDE